VRYLWPRDDLQQGPPEQFLVFSATAGRTLVLAANCPYELWLDGRFAGDGGHRSVPGIAPRDVWEEAKDARSALVRVHWIDPTRTAINLRRPHPGPFLAVEDDASWECFRDSSVRATPTEASVQLPRQNVVSGIPACGEPLALEEAPLERPWECVDFGIRRARIVPVEPREIASLTGSGTGTVDVSADDLAAGPREWSRTALPAGVVCTTLDLGCIALHRVEVTGGRCLLSWSEVPGFRDTWATSNRAGVALVDAVLEGAKRAAPFGWRGGRYLHILHRAGARPEVKVWRREYPFVWRQVPAQDSRDALILAACRANLVACTDGGLVDTCWRERGQWTGDLRMSASAIRALTQNDEVVTLALRQIAASYDEKAAMVQAVWPARQTDDRPVFIPGYHLAFCLAVVEHGMAELVPLARRSLEVWRERYVRDGLLGGFPEGSWWFVDWDPLSRASLAPDAVTHAWLHEACATLGVSSPMDVRAFDRAFWTGVAYRLYPSGDESVQATAAAVLAFPDSPHATHALDWLIAENGAGRIATRCTPYFAAFVAKALGTRSPELMRSFIRGFYHERAARWGTIPEKVTDGASLAHGWSIGIARLLLEGTDDPCNNDPGAAA
jgi:hypothetical protein